MCMCAGRYRKKPLWVSICFPPSHCECLDNNSTGHVLQMAPQPRNPLSGWRTGTSTLVLRLGAVPPPRWKTGGAVCNHMCSSTHTHIHTQTNTSHELAVVVISCPTAYNVRTSFCPPFNLSTFCCLSSSTGLHRGASLHPRCELGSDHLLLSLPSGVPCASFTCQSGGWPEDFSVAQTHKVSWLWFYYIYHNLYLSSWFSIQFSNIGPHLPLPFNFSIMTS